MGLAGGVNQKNGKIAELLFYNDKKYILRDIQENYLPDLTPYVKNSKYKPKGRRKRVVNLFNLYSLHYARFMDLIKLLEFRKGYCRNSDYELEKTGQREFICFLYRYWSCCYTKDNEYNKEKFKRQRRNENGLTKRKQEKIDKINRIEDLRKFGLKQIEIADRLGITQQLVSKLLKNFKKKEYN